MGDDLDRTMPAGEEPDQTMPAGAEGLEQTIPAGDEGLDQTMPAEAEIDGTMAAEDSAIQMSEIAKDCRSHLMQSARVVESDRLRGNVSIVKWSQIQAIIDGVAAEQGAASKTDLEAQIADYRQKMERLQQSLSEKDKQLQTAGTAAVDEVQQLRAALQEKEAELAALRQQVEDLGKKAAAGGGMLDDEIERRLALEKEIEQQRERVAVLEKEAGAGGDTLRRLKELELEVVSLKEQIEAYELGLDFFDIAEEFDETTFLGKVSQVKGAAGAAPPGVTQELDSLATEARENVEAWTKLLKKMHDGDGNFYVVAGLIRLACDNVGLERRLNGIRLAVGA